LFDDVAIMRLPKKFSRRQQPIILPDDYQGCPDLGVILYVNEGAAQYGIEPGDVMFYDMMLGREVTTDEGVIIFVHKDDLIAKVDTEGFEDVDWIEEARKAQPGGGGLANAG
jgi:co-chaperonin GroES (HSP10)